MFSRQIGEPDWALRTTAYRFLVENGRAPGADELAHEFGVTVDEVNMLLRRLHDDHALFLDLETGLIRMLNPFSAVPTPFVVEIGNRKYFANCAWDMLAIPGMLGSDALIRARLEVAGCMIELPVIDGEPQADRDYIVNYSVPFKDWYVDLVHT